MALLGKPRQPFGIPWDVEPAGALLSTLADEPRDVAGIEWPHQIFWGPYIDNNHFLNSLWIYLVGVDASPVALRSLAIATGGLSILLAGMIGRRQGGLQALLMMTLVAMS